MINDWQILSCQRFVMSQMTIQNGNGCIYICIFNSIQKHKISKNVLWALKNRLLTALDLPNKNCNILSRTMMSLYTDLTFNTKSGGVPGLTVWRSTPSW